MLTFMWLPLLGVMLLLVMGCNRGPRIKGVSWFALQPFMRESKKAKGRMQQTAKQRKRKNRR